MADNGSEKEEVITGEVVSEAYLEEFKTLSSIVSYESGIKKLEEFAKWLFTSSSIVGILGAGMSVAGFAKLTGTGEVLFTFSLLSVTLSLVLSALSLNPIPIDFNPNSKESIENVVEETLIKRRGRKLRWAGFFFASAILLAGLAPLFSKLYKTEKLPSVKLSYENITDDNITVKFSSKNLVPDRQFRIDVEKYWRNKSTVLLQTAIITDSTGSIMKEILLKKEMKISPFDSLLVRCSWNPSGTVIKDTVIRINSLNPERGNFTAKRPHKA